MFTILEHKQAKNNKKTPKIRNGSKLDNIKYGTIYLKNLIIIANFFSFACFTCYLLGLPVGCAIPRNIQGEDPKF